MTRVHFRRRNSRTVHKAFILLWHNVTCVIREKDERYGGQNEEDALRNTHKRLYCQ